MAQVTLRKVVKKYDEVLAVRGIDLDITDKEFIVLVGPSGCGKSTTLRMIAGLEEISGGDIAIGGDVVNDVPPKDRDIAMVFQNYALYPHMNVYENMSFGLKLKRTPKDEIDRRVKQAAQILDITELLDRKPKQLSGGQRQRVALARALAPDPKLLLLDEPFGALDARVRKELRGWLRRLHHEIGLTSVLVTHDQEEAFEVADRVVVMNHGRIEQEGPAQEVFDHPANAFVLDFLGNVNVFHGRVESGRAIVGGMEVEVPDYLHEGARTAKAYVRPHELEIDRYEHTGSCVRAVIQRVAYAGALVKVELYAEDFGVPLTVETTRDRWSHLGLAEGDQAFVFPRNLRLFVNEYQI